MADQQESLLEVTGWINKTQEKLLSLHKRREQLLKGNILCVSCSSAPLKLSHGKIREIVNGEIDIYSADESPLLTSSEGTMKKLLV